MFKLFLIAKNYLDQPVFNIELFPQSSLSSTKQDEGEIFNRTIQQQQQKKEFALHEIQNSSFEDSTSRLDFQDSIQQFPQSATSFLHPDVEIDQDQVLGHIPMLSS